MMREKESKSRFLNMTTLTIAGVLLLLFSAVLLLWHGNANSNQAMSALVAGVYFDGEYRINDGEWQKIVKGNHISSTEGDVTLRGNFHMLAPDGEYVGIYNDSIPIALYTNHINLTFYEGKNEPYIIDVENPLYGDSACHENWTAYTLASKSEEPIEILIHNPHSFGNETAIDEMLSRTAKEICTLFLAMGAGLIAGMGYLGFAVLFTVVMCIMLKMADMPILSPVFMPVSSRVQEKTTRFILSKKMKILVLNYGLISILTI